MAEESDSTVRFDQDDLYTFARDILAAAGLDAEHTVIVADALVTANLRGIDTHGVVRLEPYLKHLSAGGINPSPDVSVDRPRTSSLVIDGDNGPGQIATLEAMDVTIDTSKDIGVAFATVRNSNHFGTAGFYTRRAADLGCIGIAMTNVASEVAPFGGIDPYFGTNPIAYSVPTNQPFSITLDIATSIASLGKIILAEKEGRTIPEEWAIDENGRPTADPSAVHALRPVGGPKGYGLALFVDLCSGPLTGMGLSSQLGNLFADHDEPQRVGHFLGAIDVEAFRDLDGFLSDIDDLIEDIKRMAARPGFDEVKVPGEIEYETYQHRTSDGIPISNEVVETLSELAAEYGVIIPPQK